MSATVLLVEDDADVMLAARMLLETAGYVVIEASGGEEALELADEESLNGSPATVYRSIELDADRYVTKPFQAADLTRALEAVIG